MKRLFSVLFLVAFFSIGEAQLVPPPSGSLPVDLDTVSGVDTTLISIQIPPYLGGSSVKLRRLTFEQLSEYMQGAINPCDSACIQEIIDSLQAGLGDSIVTKFVRGTDSIATPALNVGEVTVSLDLKMIGGVGFTGAPGSPNRNVLYRGGTDFTILRNYTQDYTLLQLWAPPGALSEDREATIALVRGNEPNQEYLDLYNNGYESETQHGIRIQKRGTGQYRDFVFDFYDGVTKEEVLRIGPDTVSLNAPTTIKGGVGFFTTAAKSKCYFYSINVPNPVTDAYNRKLWDEKLRDCLADNTPDGYGLIGEP